MKAYWHTLTPGLISALLKLAEAVRHYGRNKIHIHDEMKAVKGAPFQLTDHEWNNFTRLRFHALAAKSGESGYWLLTHRGSQFLKNEMAVPFKVQTFRNKVTGHSEELVKFGDFRRKIKDPWFERAFEYEIQQPKPVVGATVAIQNKLFT